MLGLGQVLQAVLPQVPIGDVGQRLVAHEVSGGLREERLPAVGGGAQARAPIDRGAVVVALSQLRLPGVQGRAYPQRRRGWPRLGVQCHLDRGGGGDRAGGPGEDREAAVALAARAHEVAAVPADDLLHELVVAGEGPAHRLRGTLPKGGAPRDVGEEVGDRPDGQGRHGRAPGSGATDAGAV